MTGIYLYTSDFYNYMIPGAELNWGPILQFPLCQIVDLEEYFHSEQYENIKILKNIKMVQFYLGEIENLGISLHIIERNKVLGRTLENNYLSYDGPPIKISDLIKESGKDIKHIVKLSQTIKTEKDKKSQCKNYPFQNYLDYNDCDQTYIQNIIQNELNITPFWVTQILENVTEIGYINPNHDLDMAYFFGGISESPCYIPCKTTKVISYL